MDDPISGLSAHTQPSKSDGLYVGYLIYSTAEHVGQPQLSILTFILLGDTIDSPRIALHPPSPSTERVEMRQDINTFNAADGVARRPHGVRCVQQLYVGKILYVRIAFGADTCYPALSISLPYSMPRISYTTVSLPFPMSFMKCNWHAS